MFQIYLYILLYSFIYVNSYIQITPNNQIPIRLCINCKHFIKPCFSSVEVGKCKLFYDIDPVSGQKTYKYCSILRQYNNDCGINGTFFKWY